MKHLLMILIFFTIGCQNTERYSYTTHGNCPQVQIIRDESYLTQFVNYKETFQISIVGYEGSCHYNSSVERYQAVIRPIFKIKRIRPSDETDVRFSYYTETVRGPIEYLGKKTYYVTAPIAADATESEYKASAVKVYIPDTMKYDFDVNLGLWISPEEAKYNRRTFDVNYELMEE